MNTKFVIGMLWLLGALGAAAQGVIPARQMNVQQGPESVFDRPPEVVLPSLAGATATGENGRVGSELVFWGFTQSDGRRVFLFACAERPDVACSLRLPAICPAVTTVLEQGEASGNVVRRSCRNVATVGAGDLRPGCDDRVENTSMAVGLVTCG